MIYDKQKAFLKDNWQRINILEGSVRSGKTYALSFLIPYLALSYQGKGAIIAKTLETLRENILDPMKLILGNAMAYSDSGRRISIAGVKIRGVGANDESSKNKIQGATLAWAVGDEITLYPESFFKMLLSRLSTENAKFFGSCNPDSPFHYLKTEYINTALAKTFKFDLSDNPGLPPGYVESLKKEYTGMWYQRYILGEWCLADGLIYDMFDGKRHLIETPKNFTNVYAAIDYGINNPCVFGLFGFDATDKIYMIKEYYFDSNKAGRQKTDLDYAKDFIEFVKGYDVKGVFVDPSALSLINELRRHGVFIKSAKNDVLEGIKLVSSFLANNRFYIDKTCQNAIKEFSSYSWDKNAQKQGIDKPMKQADHAMDMIRYALYSMFGANQYRPTKQQKVL